MSEAITTSPAVTLGELTCHDVPGLGLCVSAIEHAQLVAQLRQRLRESEIDAQRSALWAAGFAMHLAHIRRVTHQFTRGLINAPWKSRERRVIGFKSDCDKVIEALGMPTPQLPTREAMGKINQSMNQEHPATP